MAARRTAVARKEVRPGMVRILSSPWAPLRAACSGLRTPARDAHMSVFRASVGM